MATKLWLGVAATVNQVDTIQITADDAATTYSVTIGGITCSVSGSGSGVNQTASDLKDALDAIKLTDSYFDLTYSLATDTITITGSSGEPFTITAADTGGTGTLSHTAEATAAESEHHWSVGANWSGGTVPTTNDEVIFDKGSTPCLWDIDQNTLSINLLRTDMAYTGYIGLNPHAFRLQGSDGAGVPEYRETHLKVDADRVEIGRPAGNGQGAGQGRVNIDNGDTGTPVCHVYNTAASARDTGQLAVDYVAADAQAELHVINAPGGVGVAVRVPGTTATLANITVAPNPANVVVVGEGTTLTNYRQDGGVCTLALAADLSGWIRMNGGTLTTLGEEWTAATVDVYAGTLYLDHYDSTTLVTTLNIWKDGVVDLTRSQRARTVSTLKQFAGGEFVFDPGYVTITTLSWENEKLRITAEK